jgi:hypothetical protein
MYFAHHGNLLAPLALVVLLGGVPFLTPFPTAWHMAVLSLLVSVWPFQWLASSWSVNRGITCSNKLLC